MGQYVAHPHTFPRNGRGTHTQVCSRCFVRYFSPHSVFPPSEKREVRYRRKDGVGDTSKVLRISDLRVKWATTSILAPFCHILASRPCFSSRGQGVVSKLGVGAIVAGVPGWEVYGSNPLCLAWYKGPAY